MPARRWIIRVAYAAALCAPCCLIAAGGAQAEQAVPRARAGLRAAAAQSAPLISDAGAAQRAKRGLAAPALTSSMAAANAVKQAWAEDMIRARASRRPGGKCASAACRAGFPAARELAGSQRAQIRNYFCGPATVSEMLAQLGRKVSQLQAARQLGTTGSGTDWSNGSGYPVPRVLNADQKRNAYVAVALPWSPTRGQTRTYETDLVTDINHHGGVPLAGNAYEVAGGPHLAGNPADLTIFHWFDIRGYSDSGAVTDYEDSVHGASSIGWSSAVPAYSAMSSASIAAILGARGYDW